MDTPFRIAVIATAYYPHSHADVLVSRWVEPREDDPAWGWSKPRSRITSLFVDQFADEDMARQVCAGHDIGLYDTVDAALCDGGSTLAVDGVLLIGEHGEYDHNALGQKLYPRKALFDRIVERFRRDGRTVPVFCDKHLSWRFDWACEMEACAREMGFMLLSSSSISLCRRTPVVDLGGTRRVEEAIGFFFGDEEAYSYHGFEFAQAILEHREGGETGVEAITVHRAADVWRRLEEGAWSDTLMTAVENAIRDENPEKIQSGDRREHCEEGLPTAMVVEYRDGMRVTHLNMTGYASNWGLALRTVGGEQLAVAPVVGDRSKFHPHFATMNRVIEDAFLSGQAPFPPQRSLFTAGLTARYMEGRSRPGQRLPTPELNLAYAAWPHGRGFVLGDP